MRYTQPLDTHHAHLDPLRRVKLLCGGRAVVVVEHGGGRRVDVVSGGPHPKATTEATAAVQHEGGKGKVKHNLAYRVNSSPSFTLGRLGS